MKSIKELGSMHGRVALVTGGAGHLGQAMGEALAENGASIVVLDMDLERAEQVITAFRDKFGGEHMALAVDLSSKEQIASVSETVERQFGRLDVLVNCAALVGTSGLKGWATAFDEQDINTWEKALQINLTGAFYLIQQTTELMRKSGKGSVINVSSIYGVAGQKVSMYEGLGYLTPAAYAASKGGLVQLTRYLATVLAPKIRVNCVSPGGIERSQNEVFAKRYCDVTPLGRMGIEEDFKGVTHFLASDLSCYITGQNIVVDGGWSL